MKALSLDHWLRAKDSLESARVLLASSPDATASRAYYCVFHAMSSYFAYEGKKFTKHAALETAVHRDLVKAGFVDALIGELFSELVKLRNVGDYGMLLHVSPEGAAEAVRSAETVFRAIQDIHPLLLEPPDADG